mgnify:FL=1
MKRLRLSQPPAPPTVRDPALNAYVRDLDEWLRSTVRTLEQVSQYNDRSTENGYTIATMGTPLRTLDFVTATAANVREFLATLAFDLKDREILR